MYCLLLRLLLDDPRLILASCCSVARRVSTSLRYCLTVLRICASWLRDALDRVEPRDDVVETARAEDDLERRVALAVDVEVAQARRDALLRDDEALLRGDEVLRVRGEVGVDLVELDVRVVPRLARLLELPVSCCSTWAWIASACSRFDVIVCPAAGPTASRSPAAAAAAKTTIGAHPVRERQNGSWSSPDRPAGGGLARHKSETLAASTDGCNRQQSQNGKFCKEGTFRGSPRASC